MGEGPYGALLRVLEESQGRGFLGPGPVPPHIELALASLPLLPDQMLRALDLGSGGGLPGLPLALARPDAHWVLLDGSTTRTRFLTQAVNRLGVQDRVTVVSARAEEAGRDADLRHTFDLVVARSFAAPGVTAECGSPFLRVGGLLVVAEPPDAADRWPPAGLAELGLERAARLEQPATYQALLQTSPCPPRYPRRVGIPSKRPLF